MQNIQNARLYWNLLKESAGVKTPSVPLSSFEQYFRAVNNPADHFYTPDEDVNCILTNVTKETNFR